MEASLKEKLNNDLKQALRNGEKIKLGTIRMVLANTKRAEDAKKAKLVVAAYGKVGITDLNQLEEHPELELSMAEISEIAKQAELNDSDILAVFAKEITQRRDSIDAYKKGNRPDLVAQEEAELAVLLTYAPQHQLSREEIAAVAKRIIAEVGARGPGDKGKVMPKIIGELKGKADGKEINAVVTELLSAIH
jgi:uncharacterized protein YqeY